MDKKSKEALRRYKKARAAPSSSDSSSSSDSDSGSSSGSYSSSSSEKKSGHRKKKGRNPSSSTDEHRKREKGHSCHQKKLEAKRNHLKRKLREAKAKKRAMGSSAVRRRVDSGSPTKVKVPGEKKHVRTASKERLRHAAEREKMRAREREQHVRSRSPRTLAKLEAKLRARKSPVSAVVRHQLSPREKIIIQTRTRERTPERKRDIKMRLDDSRERERRDRERVEREAERQKEREEALARCQERQRERERLAREKLRREKESDYVERGGERLLPRPAEREMALAQARGYNSRERSMEDEGRLRHPHAPRIRDPAYEREREYLAAEHHRVPVLERDERREREYMVIRRREVLSPGQYRDERDLYSEEERAAYARAYAEEERLLDPRWDPRELELLNDRELEKLYPPVRRGGEDWPDDDRWDDKNWGRPKLNRPPSEPDWDAEEFPGGSSRQLWDDAREKRERERVLDHVQSPNSGRSGRWPQEWRGGHQQGGDSGGGHRKGGNYRHGGGGQHAYMHDRQKFRGPPQPLMGPHFNQQGGSRFPRRQMTYTNPNLKNKLGGGGGGGHPNMSNMSGGITSIPSLLALPPILPPDDISDFTETEKQQPLLPDMSEPPPSLPLTNQSEEPKNVEEVEKTETEVKVPIEVVNEEEKVPEAAEEGALPEKIPEAETAVVKETESTEEVKKPELIEEPAPAAAPIAAPITTEDVPMETEPVPDDLSEISDSDDEILDKLDENKKPAAEVNGEVLTENLLTRSPLKDGANDDSKPEAIDDDILDFEEISDGELEEDSRIKGVGDALGVDWASLIQEAKVPMLAPSEPTTAKQKWQAHRIILDVGISLKLGGEEFGKRILSEAKAKLDAELGETKPIKIEVKQEITEEVATEDSEDVKKKIKLEIGESANEGGDDLKVNRIHPIACAQVGERLKLAEQRALILGACGPNSRALSARYDLKLRRRLCGLPALECDFRRPASEKTKSVALALFQRTMAVK